MATVDKAPAYCVRGSLNRPVPCPERPGQKAPLTSFGAPKTGFQSPDRELPDFDLGLGTLDANRINPVPSFAGFFSVKHRVPSRGWPKVRGPKSKVRTAIFQTSTLDFGPWTLDPNQSRPDFPDGGAKRRPLLCAGARQTPKAPAYCVRG